MINLNIYFFVSYLIASVEINCFSWGKKKTENKEEVALITESMKEPWAARQAY